MTLPDGDILGRFLLAKGVPQAIVQGESAAQDHFREVPKTIQMPKGAQRQVPNARPAVTSPDGEVAGRLRARGLRGPGVPAGDRVTLEMFGSFSGGSRTPMDGLRPDRFSRSRAVDEAGVFVRWGTRF